MGGRPPDSLYGKVCWSARRIRQASSAVGKYPTIPCPPPPQDPPHHPWTDPPPWRQVTQHTKGGEVTSQDVRVA
jgi:hypothetical protein